MSKPDSQAVPPPGGRHRPLSFPGGVVPKAICQRRVEGVFAEGSAEAWIHLRGDLWGMACLSSYLAYEQTAFRDACRVHSIDIEVEYVLARNKPPEPLSEGLCSELEKLHRSRPWYEDALAMLALIDGSTTITPVLIPIKPYRKTHVVGWATQPRIELLWEVARDITRRLCESYNRSSQALEDSPAAVDKVPESPTGSQKPGVTSIPWNCAAGLRRAIEWLTSYPQHTVLRAAQVSKGTGIPRNRLSVWKKDHTIEVITPKGEHEGIVVGSLVNHLKSLLEGETAQRRESGE